MSEAPLVIVPVDTAAEMDAFIKLPYRLHQDDPTWIPPLFLERREVLDPKKNPYLKRATVKLWLAKRGDAVVGRISAQMDPLVAKQRSAEEGHFGMIAAEDDPAIFKALTETAEAWLRDHGATVVFGPFNLNINEETGLLINGRDTVPMMMMGHDYGYVARHLEALGYHKGRDLNAYVWNVGGELPATLKAFEKRAPTKGMVVRPINMKDYRAEVGRLVQIFNDAWSENWGFVPMADDEVAHMANQLKPLIVPDLVWFVEMDGDPAAFLVCLPNINEAIADLNGKLLPFGWARLLWRLKVKGLKSARVPLLGVRKKYLNSMLGPFMTGSIMAKMYREVEKRGIETLEMSWVLEDNTAMNRLAEQMGGRHYKTYRIFQKSLT
ncbi:GNAT family N-acetyltransferase [Tateyamaria pelophila]|uniref:GNAT family N-acetyltransferase n=1 Tax=Tateyamaria pelophila TaxID=328415 RepID=UPI001CC17391|nr:N-acetyltransferase [Tateyamaria pelophila]